MARHRQGRRRKRKPLGLLTPEELFIHRELELLRVAGQPRPRSDEARKRHNDHVRRRAAKLEAARRLVAVDSARAV